MSKGRGNGEFSLQANGDQGGRILSQLGGFQVSGQETIGSKGSKGSKGNEQKGMQGECTMYIICAHVHNECLCE
jgi:hypothetical protein